MTDKVYMQILSPKLLLFPFFCLYIFSFFFNFFFAKVCAFFQGAGGGLGG